MKLIRTLDKSPLYQLQLPDKEVLRKKLQELVVPTLEEMWFRKSLMAVYERGYT